MLVKGLALTANVIGRAVEGGALGSAVGGVLCEETGEATYIGVGDFILEVLGAARKAQVASVAAETQALGCERPPLGAGQSGGLLIALSMPVLGREQG